MTTYQHSITTVFAMGGTEVGYSGVCTNENLMESVEGTRTILSREAQRNANILAVEEAQNTLVVVYNNGSVKVHKWLKINE